MPKKPRKKPRARKRALLFNVAEFAERVRITRDELGYTQAECPGLAKSHVCRLETQQQQPTADSLLKLRRWLGVRLDWLLDGTPPRWLTDQNVTVVAASADAAGIAELVVRRLKEAGEHHSSIDKSLVSDDKDRKPTPRRSRSR